ncbi:putative P450 monooxygenase [Boeremia exigua]|uniref:putative P450 monooxygenase n=1 Tax=Boeremia exigua TaxID=749465 RepID=UPI001E8D4C7A|nr:putative P450 monooxygenase [Boeremia exigua]KAH6618930.1 putative P450 monooxygenase [Boeremia exigua]
MAIFTLTSITVTLLSLYITRRVYWEVTVGSRLRNFAKQHGCLPAKMRQTPFTFGAAFWWGQIKAIQEHRLLPFWDQSFKEVDAHTRRHYVLGTDFFATDDPENVKAILATNFSAWGLGQDRISEMSSYLGYGIFVNEGAAWKHSREILRPCFEKSLVADVELLERHVQRLLELVPKDGTMVDLQPLLHDLSMDIATELLFGRSTDALGRKDGDDEVREFCDAFDYASNPFERAAFKKWGFITLFLPDRFNSAKKKHVKVMQDFVDRIIAAHISDSKTSDKEKHRYNFISALLESTSNHATIRSELLNILLAGRDTVAALLSNILWELPRHPSILSTLRAEIAATAGTNPPSYDDLKAMKYLRAITNEAQRLYPIVPMNGREARVDTVLPRGGGADGASPVMVPKGSQVGWISYSMQRRSDLFGDDADTFRPERWLEPGFRPGWAFVPFSGGPRVCIGQNFALTETMYVVARIVQGFELLRRDDEEWREKINITCTGLGGCKVGLTPRVE